MKIINSLSLLVIDLELVVSSLDKLCDNLSIE